jgi:23S rRNA (pseudouridine1915-N3)-methyltransferase
MLFYKATQHMQILIIAIGKKKSEFYEEAILEYTKRITKPFDLQIKILQPYESIDPNICKKMDSESLLSAVPKSSTVIVMDEHGRLLDSNAFAKTLDDHLNQSTKSLCFLIGGSYGLDQAIIGRASIILSLSKMVFPHEIARLLLVEQIYRSTTILAGKKYHH